MVYATYHPLQEPEKSVDIYIHPGGSSRPLNSQSFGKKSYFTRDVFHQQFQGTILLRVGLTSRVRSKVVFGAYCNMDVNGKH